MNLAHQWYTLCCKPRKERFIWQQLLSRGYEVFYPRILSMTKNGKRLIVKPFFPGYLFVNFNMEEDSSSKFQWMEHSIGLVCVDGKPFHIPDRLITAIQDRLFEINSTIRKTPEPNVALIYSQAQADYLICKEMTKEIYAGDEWAPALLELMAIFSVPIEKRY
jgi:transcription antitermination factor NusG